MLAFHFFKAICEMVVGQIGQLKLLFELLLLLVRVTLDTQLGLKDKDSTLEAFNLHLVFIKRSWAFHGYKIGSRFDIGT